MSTVFGEIVSEMQNQVRVWGEQNHHPERWLTILVEEVGELARATLKADIDECRDELIQIAAVAISAIESIDRVQWQRQEAE